MAFVEAFRHRGIYPTDLDTLSVDTLRWQGVDVPENDRRFDPLVERLRKFANEFLYIDDRKAIFERTRVERLNLHREIDAAIKADPTIAEALGIDPECRFEVHELRRAERTGPDGRPHPQVIVAVLQYRQIQAPGSQKMFPFYGGATLIVDLKNPGLKYAIYKRVNHPGREQETVAFLQRSLKDPVTALLLDQTRLDRFAALHSLAGGCY